ncbi:MAG: helix-hairpin-helix domain-containing protein [Clostridia bacterium]|nr:helix-hairpin-helix domain-containing protein [Clostridia bacterium]
MRNNLVNRIYKYLARFFERLNEDFCRRFLFLPVAIIVTSLAVLGVFWVEERFELPYEKRIEVKEAKEQAAKASATIRAEAKVEKMKAGDEKIDLNTATEADLQRLPGVGAVKAAEIVKQRNKMGKFWTAEDIMCTDGIGPRLFEQIKDLVKVDMY